MLNKASKWLCHQRKNYSPHSDNWDLRQNKVPILKKMASQLKKGTYTLSPVKRIRINHKETSLWSSKDSLALKKTSLELQKKLKGALKKVFQSVKKKTLEGLSGNT